MLNAYIIRLFRFCPPGVVRLFMSSSGIFVTGYRCIETEENIKLHYYFDKCQQDHQVILVKANVDRDHESLFVSYYFNGTYYCWLCYIIKTEFK